MKYIYMYSIIYVFVKNYCSETPPDTERNRKRKRQTERDKRDRRVDRCTLGTTQPAEVHQPPHKSTTTEYTENNNRIMHKYADATHKQNGITKKQPHTTQIYNINYNTLKIQSNSFIVRCALSHQHPASSASSSALSPHKQLTHPTPNTCTQN